MAEYFNAFMAGLLQMVNWNAFWLMLLGIAIGFAVGLLPGLGNTTSLALMLPFVVKMKAVDAFVFLLAMLAVTNTTGDITSILFGIPGEPTTAATVLDGHPMAKKGEAGRALGAALMSSLVGAIFAGFALATAIPIIRPLVLTFGSPEFFMLTVVGLTFVAALSGADLLKGLISGGIGLFLATVGLDQISGIQRFTFRQLFLWDGIGIVPLCIGFFAVPEIIDLAVQGSSISRGRVSALGGVMEGVKDTFRHIWLVIRCSAIGAYIAVIPGLGGATTQWLAYAHAVQSSRDKERFGKGAVEGVLGPGAANNSTMGGSLITSVALGIPASVTMAILMGAFIIQGLVPGPDMLIPEPRGHLSLTFSFVWTMIISNVIAVGICFLFLNQLAKTTRIRGSLIIPFILQLIYLGAFAEKNVFADLFLGLFFGGLGWVMLRFNWPRAPLLLGVVLGPLAENRLFLSTDNYGLAWLSRPGVLFFILLTLIGACYPMLRKRKRYSNKSSSPKAMDLAGTGAVNFTWAVVFDLVIVIVLICALWNSRTFNFRAGLFPWTIGLPLLALSVVQLIRELMGRGGSGADRDDLLADTGSELAPNVVKYRTALISAWLVGYLVAIWLLGFAIGLSVCTFLQVKFGSREKWPISLIMTASTYLFIYGLFQRALHVPFPKPYLYSWLKAFI